jgi:hypothetical protein
MRSAINLLIFSILENEAASFLQEKSINTLMWRYFKLNCPNYEHVRVFA